MKTLIRWGVTLGLVTGAILYSAFNQPRPVFSLPQEEIFKLLRGIPVFMLVDDKNIPLGGKVDEKTMDNAKSRRIRRSVKKHQHRNQQATRRRRS